MEYINDHLGKPLIIHNMSILDMIDILNTTGLTESHSDSPNTPTNSHITFLQDKAHLFLETGDFSPELWENVVFPYLPSCIMNYILKPIPVNL